VLIYYEFIKEEKPLVSGLNSKSKKLIIITLVILIAAGSIGYYLFSRDKVSTDDAYLDGHIYSINPRVAGFTTDVSVTDNQEVKKGQTLVNLDPIPFETALAAAKASLAEAEATLASLDLGVPLELNQTAQRVTAAEADLKGLKQNIEMAREQEEAAEQELKRAEADKEQLRLDYNRQEELMKTRAISQSALDKAKSQYDSASARVSSAMATRASLTKQIASLSSGLTRQEANISLAATGKDTAEIKTRQVKAQQAKVDLAKARLKEAELDLSYTDITSPIDGFVSKKSIEPGVTVSKGQPLMAIVPLNPGELWVTANYKETQLSHVRPGQAVEIKVDTYPGVTIKGKVDSIMSGTGSAFSLFPAENASGNFVKVVQRIPVKITIQKENSDPLPALRIGMSVTPIIHTGK
jgi:membrane fusion protein, multidrug efflux system